MVGHASFGKWAEADPPCMTDPILQLNLRDPGMSDIVWGTGCALDFGWLKVDIFNERSASARRNGCAWAVSPGAELAVPPGLELCLQCRT
jgi:hypothetical protein